MAFAARPPLDRVAERRRAAALARHYRDAEQLPIAEIARRLGRAPATVKAYLYDPTGEMARAVKARYHGYCRICGADTSPRNGKGDAYRYCHPGAAAPKWTRERVREAMRRWAQPYLDDRRVLGCDEEALLRHAWRAAYSPPAYSRRPRRVS